MSARRPVFARNALVLTVALACAAGAFGIGVKSAFDRDMAKARAAASGPARVIESPYGPIQYADVGSGEPVLVIHGSGGGFDQGLLFGRRLQRPGLRIIAPSRFGYLGSAMPKGGSPEMQADALAFLVKRLGVKRVAIFGGSAGALSATQLALRHPELCRALVLGVPAIYAPERAPGTNAAPGPMVQKLIDAALGSDFVFWTGIKVAPNFMTRMVLATDPAVVKRASPAEQRRVREVLDRILPVSGRKRGLLLDSATAGAPPPYPVERIDCPTLIFSARDDLYGTAASAAYTARRVPGARLVLYDRGGHLWVGHDEDVWDRVAAFVEAPRG